MKAALNGSWEVTGKKLTRFGERFSSKRSFTASRSDDKQASIRIGGIGKASFDVVLGEIGEVG
jgi:hypothetical protein